MLIIHNIMPGIFFTFLLLMSNLAYSLSEDDLEKVEKEFIYQINQSNQVIRDPLAVEYINHLGRRLAKQTPLKHYFFFLVKSQEINAFAGPGGYIGVNSGLILASDTESELAAVMAHELSHVALSHIYRMLEHQKQMTIPMVATTLASIALGILNPALGNGALMATLSGYAQDSINFTRANEKEADRRGIEILYKAGLDPDGMADFFKKLQQQDRYYYTSHIPAILRTHPLDEDRIAQAENRTAQLKPQHPKSSLNYYLFKEQIRVLSSNTPFKLLAYYTALKNKDPHNKAINYGRSLTYLKLSRFQEAKRELTTLASQDPDNLHYQLPLAEAEIGLGQTQQALTRLNDMYQNFPDNYATIMAYANGLESTSHYKQAADLLWKNKRDFPKDINLCTKLARALSEAKEKSRAYFTQAQCLLLQGERRGAMKQLQQAQKLNHRDKLLGLQIKALIQSIKDSLNA